MTTQYVEEPKVTETPEEVIGAIVQVGEPDGWSILLNPSDPLVQIGCLTGFDWLGDSLTIVREYVEQHPGVTEEEVVEEYNRGVPFLHLVRTSEIPDDLPPLR